MKWYLVLVVLYIGICIADIALFTGICIADIALFTGVCIADIALFTGVCIADFALLPILLHCSGELPKNHAILREISSLCHQLPILTSSDFSSEHQKVSPG